MTIQAHNPLTKLDYPDVDVIRVDDTYYMVSTTMYFMPGCEILRSYDLANWEHAAYVYDMLDGTERQRLCGEQNIYGCGMWAASLRYHKGTFYVCFVANDTHKTYLFTSESVEGPWKKQYIEGFYHDCSLFFDDDDRVYIVYGGRQIRITELKPDLSGPLEGGLDRIAVVDPWKHNLGYEGSHFYKINGKYYLFLIHSLEDRWMRTEACYAADSLDGEFTGGDVLEDDMGYCGQGVAQGGIVDTPDGTWYAILFQDSGAVGRIPVLVPVTWKDDYPMFGIDGRVPHRIPVESTRPGHTYEPLVGSDDFRTASEDRRLYDSFGFRSAWQFNHEPELTLVHHDREAGTVRITTGKLCGDVTQARNTLTQRMIYPGCTGEVTVDVCRLNEGDFAGLCALQSAFGLIAVTKRDGGTYLVMQRADFDRANVRTVTEEEAVPVTGDTFRLRVTAEFTEMKDEVRFAYLDGTEWKPLGPVHKMKYRLDHFTGYRFALFVYSTAETGGSAAFSDFIYTKQEEKEQTV